MIFLSAEAGAGMVGLMLVHPMSPFHGIARALLGISLTLVVLAHCANRHEDAIIDLALAAGPSPESRTVLIIGDSLTVFSEGFGLAAAMGSEYRVDYKAVVGYDFAAWTLLMDEAFAESDGIPPGRILIPLGTNDGFRFTTDQYLANLNEFHAELRTRSQARATYFQMPRTNDAAVAARILEFNRALPANMPTDNTSLIDLDSLFQNANSYPNLYDATDPIHPTETGYLLVREAMKSDLLR